ncbi:hypothetical protein [Polaromonas sp. CG9_12]|nr:hypothetical protein [Polaromonas sp. CG9_12]
MKASKKTSSVAPAQATPLTFYEVDGSGTLTDPSVRPPSLRSDVFQNVSPSYLHSTDDLIEEVDRCTPLAIHFSCLADERLSEIEDELADEDSDLGIMARRRLAFLADELRGDPDTGWHVWVTHEGDLGLASFKELIQDWLDDEINWGEEDYFDDVWSGQSASLQFFSDLEASVRKALGVVIIDGEHPGSSYYGAELRGDIAQANQTAQDLGLTFRFRDQGKVAPDVPGASPQSPAGAGSGACS